MHRTSTPSFARRSSTGSFPRRPALVAAAVAGVLALLVAVLSVGRAPSAGAAGRSGTAGRAGADGTPGPVAQALSATAAARSAQVSSTLRFELVPPGGGRAIVASAQHVAGRFETSGRRAVVTVRDEGPAGATVVQRLRLDRPRYWLSGAPGEEFAPGKPWALADLDALEARLGAVAADRFLAGLRTASAADATPVLEVLRAVRTTPASAVRDLGPAVRGGEPVRRWGVQVDVRRLYKALGTRAADEKAWLPASLVGWFPDPLVPAVVELDGVGRLRTLAFQAVLDPSESELRGVVLEAERRAGAAGRPVAVPDGSRLRLVFRAALSRFGAPVTVTPPPASQVADLFDVLPVGP